jgi:ribosome-associated protein
MDDLRINDVISIPADELEWTFSPSGGPGGQHANRSSTRAEVRLDVAASRAFDDMTRQTVLRRIDPETVISATADETRSQWRNRRQAARRLADRIRETLAPEPPARRPTKPSRAARRRRIDEKRSRSRTKSLRQTPRADD